MSAVYARGSRALGICDQCGLERLLNRLRYQPRFGRMTSLRVCAQCYDEDNPQGWALGLVQVADPQALRDPRPDTTVPPPVSYLSWDGSFIVYGPYEYLAWSV